MKHKVRVCSPLEKVEWIGYRQKIFPELQQQKT